MVNARHTALRTHAESGILQSTRFSFHSILNGGVRADSGEPETIPVKHYLTLPSKITPQPICIITYLAQILFLSFISFVFILKKIPMYQQSRDQKHTWDFCRTKAAHVFNYGEVSIIIILNMFTLYPLKTEKKEAMGKCRQHTVSLIFR